MQDQIKALQGMFAATRDGMLQESAGLRQQLGVALECIGALKSELDLLKNVIGTEGLSANVNAERLLRECGHPR